MAEPEGTAARPTVLRVSELTRSYGAQRAVDRLSFSVQAGEVLGLLGPNLTAAHCTTLTDADIVMMLRLQRERMNGRRLVIRNGRIEAELPARDAAEGGR